MSKRSHVSLFLILLIGSLGIIPSVRADIPPPIYCAWIDSGSFFTLASNVSLPEATVDVNINLTDSWSYNINVSCLFTISSLVSQNLTTAFVYPEAWFYADPSQTISVLSFNIWVNETPVEYAIFAFDEFKSKYDLNQTNWDLVDDCSFALFNFSATAEQPTDVKVNTHFITSSTGHNFYFDYIVDTARRWEGNTHEIVEIGFQRANDTKIIKYSYNPENNSEFTGDSYSAVVIWDFSIQEFPFDRVGFQVQQQEYPKYHGIRPVQNPLLIGIAAAVILFILANYLIWRRFGTH